MAGGPAPSDSGSGGSGPGASSPEIVYYSSAGVSIVPAPNVRLSGLLQLVRCGRGEPCSLSWEPDLEDAGTYALDVELDAIRAVRRAPAGAYGGSASSAVLILVLGTGATCPPLHLQSGQVGPLMALVEDHSALVKSPDENLWINGINERGEEVL